MTDIFSEQRLRVEEESRLNDTALKLIRKTKRHLGLGSEGGLVMRYVDLGNGDRVQVDYSCYGSDTGIVYYQRVRNGLSVAQGIISSRILGKPPLISHDFFNSETGKWGHVKNDNAATDGADSEIALVLAVPLGQATRR